MTILTLNCGSTSTKVAWFGDDRVLARSTLDVSLDDSGASRSVLDQLDLRTAQVRDFLTGHGLDLAELDMVVARAGAIWHVPHGGAYEVNELMVATLRNAPAAQHASSLSCLIGTGLVAEAGLDVPVIVYDPTCIDDVDPVAKVTGLPEIVNMPVLHRLNTRMAGSTYAASIGRAYEDLHLVIAHLGGGISLGLHSGGRVVDWVYDDEGPMSPQRAGRLPTRYLVDLCYRAGRSQQEMRTYLAGRGGLAAHLGTQDVREVERLIDAGDTHAELVYRAMALGVAKAIGELAVVRGGEIDQILFTGGIAHSELFTGWVRERVEFIAGVTVLPGEQEMEALAAGGRRVLAGTEPLHPYTVLPPGYSSLAELLARPSYLAQAPA